MLLSGHVASYAEKLAAERAVKRVKGVSGIAEEISVRYPGAKQTADDQIFPGGTAFLCDAGMCGPIACSLMSLKGQDEDPQTTAALYHIGRLVSYASLGALADSIEVALGEVFPELPGPGRIAIKNLITLAADGRLSKASFAGYTLKDVVIAEIGKSDPELAGNARAVDFVVMVVSQFPSTPD